MSPKVLVVEDDRFFLSILNNRLQKEGFSVIQALDGQQALDLLKTEKPDLILLDIIMPRVSGFDVLKSISVDPEVSRTPVVVLSNLGQESDIERARSYGVTDYNVKIKTSIDQVIDNIKNTLSRLRGSN